MNNYFETGYFAVEFLTAKLESHIGIIRWQIYIKIKKNT